VVNFNLIEEGGRLLLVDAGAPGDWDLLVRAVADLGRGLDDLEAVLLTHGHPTTSARPSATARLVLTPGRAGWSR
jgi:glyoxylase-like metal-dependent hydrolase (beta-lactamase superfamily II)